jgi:enamine deaminase RidA (YjgF/YER057c/UK114 family)
MKTLLKAAVISLASLTMMSGCVINASSVDKDLTNVERHYFNDYELDLGFAQVVQVGKTLYISGIPAGGKNMEEAMTIVYERIAEILKKFDATPNNIVKETIYTTDMNALKKLNSVRMSFFSDKKYPASTWVEISRLYDEGYLIEVDVVAQLD